MVLLKFRLCLSVSSLDTLRSDAVTSLAGIPVDTDKWQIDAIYSGTQKCISCPPGLSPVSFSEAAREVMTQRTTPIQINTLY